LFFCVLFARLSDSRPARPQWAAPGWHISPENRRVRGLLRALLVCADAALARLQQSRAHGAVLDRHDRLAPTVSEFMAARNAGDLLRDVPLFRHRRAGFLRIPIGWHAPCRRLYRLFLRAGQFASSLG